MFSRKRLPAIDVERSWSAKHAHHMLRIAEDTEGRIWLRHEDLRQWVPGLAAADLLSQRHPGMVRRIEPASDPYIEATAFAWVTKKSTNTATLKLLAWLEASILAPARRRHEWQDYRPHQASAIPSRLLAANATDRAPHELLQGGLRDQLDEQSKQLRGAGARRLFDPRRWAIGQGRWGLWTVLAVGLLGSSASFYLGGVVDERAYDVLNNYVAWTWAAILISVWAVLFTLGWIVGAVRSGIRRSGVGFSAWATLALVVINVSTAAYLFGGTLHRTQELVRVWWAVYVDGDPAIDVTVVHRNADGSARRLSLQGPIGIGSTKVLVGVLQQNPGATEILLESPGGLVVEGFGLAKAIKESSLKTTLVDKSCASACTLLFAMGETRAVAPKAVVGFHRSYSIFGDFGTGWSATEYRMADLLRSHGVSDAFIRRAFAVPGYSMYEPDVSELLEAGVATVVAE